MNIDFVKTPFTNNPTMNRYDGPVFNKKPDSSYLIEKQKEQYKQSFFNANKENNSTI